MGARRLAVAAVDFRPRQATCAARPRSDAGSAIPLIGRWKMIDNLRRTLSAPAAFLALVAGWTLLLASAAIWTGFVVATLAMPALLPVLTGLVPRRLGISKRSHVRAVGADLAACRVADRAARHPSRASGVADDRRDRTNAVPPVREASADARVGDRRAGEVDARSSIFAGSIGRMAGGVALGARGRGRGCVRGTRSMA